MSNLSQKLKNGAIAAAIGGSLFAGTEYGKPECDFVFVDNEKEVCMTVEQAQAIVNNLKGSNTGFGQSQFQDIDYYIKEK